MSRPANTQFAVAVHVLTMLAGLPRELQTSEVMAASVGSNPVHIRRVLARLRKAGSSRRGLARTAAGSSCIRRRRRLSPTYGG